MGNWFSKGKKGGGGGSGGGGGGTGSPSRVTEQDKAVLQLKQQRDKVKQYQQRLLATLEKERELAKKLLHDGKKDRAKLLLKKKRFQESQLEKSDNQLDNLEKLVHDLEFAQVEIQVLDGLKAGNAALQKIHEVLSVDDVERILEETREGIEKQQEIDALLSNNLSPEDLEAVETEFEKIMAEENVTREQLSPEEDHASLPDVPETPLPEIIAREKERAMRSHEKVPVAAS